jgi:hypothetical protein
VPRAGAAQAAYAGNAARSLLLLKEQELSKLRETALEELEAQVPV